MSDLRKQLITVAEAYGTAKGLSRSRVSTILFNAGGALNRIVAGGDVNTSTFERVIRFMSETWPDSAMWPDGIPRPASRGESAA
jgi:hypothetical protein